MGAVTRISAFEVPERAVERARREWPDDLAFMRGQPGFEAGPFCGNRNPWGGVAFVSVSRWRDEAAVAAARDGLAIGASTAPRAAAKPGPRPASAWPRASST